MAMGSIEPVPEPVEEPPANTGMPAIERVPWSVLGPEFAMAWGRADPKNPEPEHVEIIGMSGSGKTYLMLKILQDRMRVRNSHITLVVTKRADKVFARLGWPVVHTLRDVSRYRVCIYWPQTNLLGQQRKAYHEARIYELLTTLWQPEANRVIAFDEIAYVEGLSPRVKELLNMYLREGRSNGITVVGMKQRPQGIQRDLHSETQWTFAFVPKDRSDAERFAELFGSRKEWLPVFDSMDPDNHEFLVRHTRTRVAYVSWIDEPLVPVKPKDNQRGTISVLVRK